MNSILYDACASCSEGQWEKSKFLVSIRERHSTTRRGVRKWLTAPEMDTRFGAENGNLIRNRKLLDPELKERETREHPELPGNQDGRWHYDFEKNMSRNCASYSAIVASTHR